MPYNALKMDNPKLFEKKLSILNEISSAIVATDNIRAIANLILDLAINYTNAEKGSLMLLNEKEELYILEARGIDIHFIRSYRLKVGEGIAGTVAEQKTPVLVEDIETDERFKIRKSRDRFKTRSFISCPIISRNRLLGVLNINDKADGVFKEDELSLIKILANQAAIVLEDAFLMNQLRFKASELEDLNRKLIETDVVKTEFLTRISHELRTPLNSIKGAIYYLQNADKIKGEQKEFQSIISNETDKLIGLVENLLDFLMLENEMKVIKKTVLSLPEVLESDVLGSKLLNVTLSRKNINLTADLSKSITEVVGDKIRIVQFFINIIEGLCQYLESGDSIAVRLHENDDVEVKLTASRKLPELVIPFLFSPSHLSGGGQEKDKLKLYLASKTAEVHKWGLHAENTADAFEITIHVPKSAREKVDAIIDLTMEKFMEFISELLDVNTCSIMLDNKLTGELTIKSARGLGEDVVNRTRIKFGDSVAGWVALEGKPLLIEDIESDPRFRRKSISQYNTKSLISLPLKIKGNVIGVLNLNNKKTAGPFTEQDLSLASILGERITNFINTLNSGDYFDEDLKQFVSTFDNLLNAEKTYQKKYQKKRGVFSSLLTRTMDMLGADEEQKKTAQYVSMIYDLGLMTIDENVLDKKVLTHSEKCTVKAHPFNTLGLLNNFEFSEEVKKIILHHHERWDGEGYPDKLRGEEIPFISRVLSVVDAFCAMVSERPYRKTVSPQEAVEDIKKHAGSIYDPAIVSALEKVLKAHPQN
jgi:HD-GYP domain-containing protein (c-di-GMP phosphodiesterase class II)